MAIKRLVQATIIFDVDVDQATGKPWELSVLAEHGMREYSKRTWDAPRSFKDLMSLTAYMVTYPEGD